MLLLCYQIEPIDQPNCKTKEIFLFKDVDLLNCVLLGPTVHMV